MFTSSYGTFRYREVRLFLRERREDLCSSVLFTIVGSAPDEKPMNAAIIDTMSANRLNVVVTLVLAVAFLAAESGNAQADGYPQFGPKRPSMSAPQKYCGKKLSNALQIICDGVYNSMFKKSVQAPEEGNTGRIGNNFNYAGVQEMQMADYPVYSPFMSPTKAQGILDGRFAGRRRRESRGIHEECCLNACTISELSSYCGNLNN
nr:PREDICTED: LIRP isoform X1 [Linepithema humile]